MEVTTRLATVDDAEAIALAHTRAWQRAYRGIVNADFLDNINLDERVERWRENLLKVRVPEGVPDPTDYVAEVDGNVVGFANVGVWRQAPDDATLAELWAMYVHPDHWGTGAGHALMGATIEQFHRVGAHTAFLWVLEDNARARRFYERQGWQVDPVTQEEQIAGDIIIERRYSITLGEK